jgi:iron(III) transport system permease protein
MRQHWGLQGALLPEVRSVWGAAVVLTLALYPYVYLLARTALADRANHLMEAARLLGAPLHRRIWQVALPLARPAIAAGTALALMETLADFGVSSYFGIQTFTAGIYKAWIVMDDHIAAAQLATALLVLVAGVLGMELRAEARMRFSSARSDRHGAESLPFALKGLHAAVAVLLCSMPVALGFVVPVLILLFSLGALDPTAVVWSRFAQWSATSLSLGVVTSVLAVGEALFVSAFARLRPAWDARLAVRAMGLGYAVPGVVIVVGLLLPFGWLQNRFPNLGLGYWLTATSLGLLWAYLVRFVAVALQAVQSGYARISPSLDESSRMLGAPAWVVLLKVHLPLLRRPLSAAALLVLVDVMKELPVTLVLRPFNTDTLAVMAYQLARDERLGEAALPSLALVAVGLLPVILLSRTLRR